MASGQVNRIKRPDTWLHRPMLRNVKKVLANPEPSTHDPTATSANPPAPRYLNSPTSLLLMCELLASGMS